MKTLPTVAIVGRPNVGKSSLFNRFVGRRVAIVDPMPGVTRDRIEGYVTWKGKEFCLLDTGGVDFDGRLRMKQEIHRQVDMALSQADVVLLLVDTVEGLLPLDSEIMKKLRILNKPLLVAANKSDNEKVDASAGGFYVLGVEKIYPVSALHGRGIGDLLDEMVRLLPDGSAPPLEGGLKVGILGKPNVGKSSFVNALLQEQRMIVDEVPGTTRDAVDVRLEIDGKTVILTDTAGVKRSKQWVNATEFYSVSRAQTSVHRSDVIVFVFDAMEGITQQDRKLVELVQEEGKPMVFCLNKWDLVHGVDTKEYANAFFEEIQFAKHVPLIYTSALQRKNVEKCMAEAIAVYGEAGKSIPTKALNKVMERLQKRQGHPLAKGGRRVKIFFASQTGTHPPFFTLFVTDKALMSRTYMHYVEGQIRDAFGFDGVPIRFGFRNRRDS